MPKLMNFLLWCVEDERVWYYYTACAIIGLTAGQAIIWFTA